MNKKNSNNNNNNDNDYNKQIKSKNENKYNYRMHAIMMKRLLKKLSPMKCLIGPILKGCLSDLSDLNMPKDYPKKEWKA